MEETKELPEVTPGDTSDVIRETQPDPKSESEEPKSKVDNPDLDKDKSSQNESKDNSDNKQVDEEMEVEEAQSEKSDDPDIDLQPTDLSIKKSEGGTSANSSGLMEESMNSNGSDLEKEENPQSTSKSENFIIVIEPKTDSSRSQSPRSPNDPDLTPVDPVSTTSDDLDGSGLRIEGVYSLQYNSNRSGDPQNLHSFAPVVIQPVSESYELSQPKRNNLMHLSRNSTVKPRPLTVLKRKHLIQSRDRKRGIVQTGSPLNKSADVIVLENLPEVIWVQSRKVVMPTSKVKVTPQKEAKVTGSKVIGSLQTLLLHNAKAAPQAVPPGCLYACPRCHVGFSVHSDWMRHRQQCLGESSESSLLYYCNRCPASFSRHRDWVSHRKSHTVVTKMWECDRCDAKYTSRRDLRDHRAECVDLPLTKKPKFRCEICNKAFPYPSALKVHSETHVLKHKCPICDQPFTRFYEMTKHVRNKHPDVETHSCDVCGKVFDRLTMLYRHKSDGQCLPTNS